MTTTQLRIEQSEIKARLNEKAETLAALRNILFELRVLTEKVDDLTIELRQNDAAIAALRGACPALSQAERGKHDAKIG